MAETPTQLIPYGGPFDAPNVPYWMQRMAERLDTLLTALFTVQPAGHMGMTAGFHQLNSSPGIRPNMSQAQVLKGGMTFDDAADALVVPKAGTYLLVAAGYFSGSSSGSNIVVPMVTRGAAAAIEVGSPAMGPKPDSSDVRYSATSLVALQAGDKISLLQKSPVSAWGSTGYNGSALTLTWYSA